MNDRQRPPKVKHVKIRADQLKVHPLAQREIVKSNLKRIITNLDLDAIGTLQAVEYDQRGVLVIDGQHRLRALLHHEFGEWQVDVQIHQYVTSDSQACDLFLKLNKGAAVSTYESFMKEWHAGHPEARGVYRLCNHHGLKIGKTPFDGTIACVGALKKVFAVDNGDSLSRVLGVIVGAWGSRRQALEARLVDGLGLVVQRYKDVLDYAALQSKLAKYPGGPAGLLGSARGLLQHQKSSVARCVAELVIQLYNKQRSTGKLEPL